uniref:Uncharacterized protein n=1 Tax=Naja naja TaxID=35670 RepID=A0A8C6YFV9_NAJNA
MEPHQYYEELGVCSLLIRKEFAFPVLIIKEPATIILCFPSPPLPCRLPSKMAARLMHRWYWLYRTFSPLGHQAGLLSQAPWSNRPPFASRTTYNLSQVADRFSVKELESKTPEKSTRWDDLIMASSSVEELLAPEHLHNIGGNQAALLITRLSHLASQLKLDHEDILKDKRFQHLLHHTYKEVGSLINLLKSLYFLGVRPQQKELCSAEQELRWRLRGLSYRRLASLATYLAAYVAREKPHELLTELLAQLEMRWAEIEDAHTIALLMAKQEYLSPQLRERLEDKSLELAAHFSPEDIRRLAVVLAQQNLRSLPLLRAISYHFVQKHLAVKPDILLDLAFAFGEQSLISRPPPQNTFSGENLDSSGELAESRVFKTSLKKTSRNSSCLLNNKKHLLI